MLKWYIHKTVAALIHTWVSKYPSNFLCTPFLLVPTHSFSYQNNISLKLLPFRKFTIFPILILPLSPFTGAGRASLPIFVDLFLFFLCVQNRLDYTNSDFLTYILALKFIIKHTYLHPCMHSRIPIPKSKTFSFRSIITFPFS